MPFHDIDRFRGWALTALYGSMAILAMMLLLATYQIWSASADNSILLFLMAAAGVASVVSSATTCTRFLHIMRASESVPKLSLPPFLFLALTLFLASQLFVAGQA